jgi:hypothetical protein
MQYRIYQIRNQDQSYRAKRRQPIIESFNLPATTSASVVVPHDRVGVKVLTVATFVRDDELIVIAHITLRIIHLIFLVVELLVTEL